MSKNKTNATVNATIEAAVEKKAVKREGPAPEFMSFYNKATRERYTNSIMVAIPAAQLKEMLAGGAETICVCELEVSSLMKWNKEAKKAEFSYLGVSVKKPVTGEKEFKEVKKLVIGHNDKFNTKWVMMPALEQAAAKKQEIAC